MNQLNQHKSAVKIILIAVFSFLIPWVAGADYQGQRVTFFIDSSYDTFGRSQTTAFLKRISVRAYFYIDEKWWNSLNMIEKEKAETNLFDLAEEFDSKIYPTLTSTFGSEPKPGIDKDERLTILIHQMPEEAGGYINTGDAFPKLQSPKSNEREMVYLNANHLDKSIVKSFLAHEFLHLITFNQKDLLRAISEEIWLNEARSEAAITLLGYNKNYQGSNLEIRVRDFLKWPSDPLTEWLNKKADYGVINLFSQYLIDHYGIKILSDSLKSKKIGIPSLNYALAKNGFKEDFSQIFTDWTVTVLVNDCSLGEKYCYLNENLNNLRITPQINFLPLYGETILTVSNFIANWTGNWQKISGGRGNLILEFDGSDEVSFKVPYLICDLKNQCSINFLALDRYQNGELVFSNFNKNYSSLTLIPSIQTKISDFEGKENTYPFSFKISTREEKVKEKEAELRKKLLARIEFLKKEIARLRVEINAILAKKELSSFSCQKFENDLYFGLTNNSEVRCLQEFLKAQGPEIYPEGLVTGNFLYFTQSAVIRFQKKYTSKILAPWGLKKGTGFVGPTTRAKINQLLHQPQP